MTSNRTPDENDGVERAQGGKPSGVSVLVPTHDRCEQLERTLRGIAAVEAVPAVEVEVVVIANACTDGTAAMVASRAAAFPFELRSIEEPLPGLNLARNRALSAARHDLLAFLDDDVDVDRQWLRGLVESFVTTPAAVVAGRVLLDLEHAPSWPVTPTAQRLLSQVDLGDKPHELVERTRIAGANFAFRREVFAAVGEFRSGLDRSGHDLLSGGDSDLVARARAAGFRVFYAPEMSVRHRIPSGRLRLDYLARLARGRGRTRVALATLDGAPSRRALLRVGAAQTISGLRGEIAGTLLRRADERIEGRLLWMRGLGVLSALAAGGGRPTDPAGSRSS
jgi:glycosyltransferase involved in cell wall biosynthesis